MLLLLQKKGKTDNYQNLTGFNAVISNYETKKEIYIVKNACTHMGLVIIMFLSMPLAQAQDTTYVDVVDLVESSGVRWIKQIPPLKQDIAKPNKGWLKRLLLGKKNISSFQNPIYAIGSGQQSAIVLDQGHGIIFYAEEENLKIPNVIRKKEFQFPSLVAACLLPSRELLFTDSKLNAIYVLAEDNKSIRKLNESLLLQQPTGIAYSRAKDQIWVVETTAHQISILDKDGNRIKTLGIRGMGPGEFNYPTHIWIDKEGTAYVVDALNYRVQIFDANGNFKSMFGENGDGTGYMARPKGIATDSYGHIYVVDALFHGVQIFDKEGNYLYQFGKQGRQVREFWMPSGIYIDDENHIFVTDSYNSRIQIFELIYTE